MIACSCHAVSDRAIRAAAASGLGAAEIARATGAGTDCGCCADLVSRIVHEETCSSSAVPCPGCPRRGPTH